MYEGYAFFIIRAFWIVAVSLGPLVLLVYGEDIRYGSGLFGFRCCGKVSFFCKLVSPRGDDCFVLSHYNRRILVSLIYNFIYIDARGLFLKVLGVVYCFSSFAFVSSIRFVWSFRFIYLGKIWNLYCHISYMCAYDCLVMYCNLCVRIVE